MKQDSDTCVSVNIDRTLKSFYCILHKQPEHMFVQENREEHMLFTKMCF